MKKISNLFNLFKLRDKNGRDIEVNYVLESEPKTKEDILNLLTQFNLSQYMAQIEPLIKPIISLELNSSKEETISLKTSKIGGKPHLPQGISWPKTNKGISMSFIAQLNISEFKNFDVENLFPKDGIISFFYCQDQSVWGFDPNDKNSFKVLYFDKDSSLRKVQFPKDLKEESIFKPNTLKFSKALSIPTWNDDVLLTIIDDKDSDNYFEVSQGVENQILGYANNVQNTMELECQLVTNGLYCGDPSGFNDPRSIELKSGKDDWVLLLQLDSDEDKTGMMWGDLGTIYFWIKKQDLKNKRFNNAWCILQCH